MEDILLDDNDDLIIEDGDFKLGDSLTQDVGIILRLNQGELKSDPLLGAGIIRLINSSIDDDELQTRIKLHLQRDGKDYEDIKKYITLNTRRS
jgi:phage baseplate assembly protein W